MKTIPELLAPAGNAESALAAFESGADAVYGGLYKFNAREKSDNFTLEEFSRISAYAKKHGKKIFLTLNTLVKEQELEEVYNYLSQIAELEPDAVIVQDAGIVWMIKRFFPELSIHASTQMGIHNTYGVKTAEAMGIKRVILERQVTIEELKAVIRKTDMEIEVFAHGALCCSLSGNCLFSSWIGGWSGNRGRCKQPCRRRYHSKNSGNGFYFSPDDLYTLDMVPELAEAGVVSLKIEGRLKKPDYVSRTVSAYRMVLDDTTGSSSVVGKAKMILSGSPGRKWSPGFYTESAMENLVNHRSPGVSGMLIGETISVSPGGFSVNLSRELKQGDRIRIQPKSGEDGPQLTVASMYINRKLVRKASKGDKVFIKYPQQTEQGGMVYKTGDNFGKPSEKIKSIPEYKTREKIDLEIHVNREGITVRTDSLPELGEWNKKLAIDPARKHSLSDEQIEEAFRATRDSGIYAGKISVKIEGDLFLPASTLKSIRREFWDTVSPAVTEKAYSDKPANNIFEFMQIHSEYMGTNEDTKPEGAVYLTDQDRSGENKSKKIYKGDIHACPVETPVKDCPEAVLPFFTSEFNTERLAKQIAAAYKSGIRRFRITSLSHFSFLENYEDIHITVSYPLPAANSFSARQMKELGADKIQAWIELEKIAIMSLTDFSPLPVELYRYGRPHLFATRAKINVRGPITDSHGGEFFVEKDQSTGLTCIYSPEVLKLPNLENTSAFRDYTRADPNEKTVSEFNFKTEWV